jgi:hypothetical protein
MASSGHKKSGLSHRLRPLEGNLAEMVVFA